MAQTHPDRLASVATLFGMHPRPVENCRFLEIGCGDGNNLLPMAYSLPHSSFTGIDLAGEAVALGRTALSELELSNCEIAELDLRDFGPQWGEFDYIVAHGLYSWIPDDVRTSLLSLCRDRLAPQGVAFVSYNAFPGRHVRLMFREMLLHHTRHSADPAQRIEQARAFVRMLGESRMVAGAWKPMIQDEVERLLSSNTGWLFHDDLAPINDSFYFRDFAARAAGHSLQYLGDAEPHLMFDPHGALDGMQAGILEREQYLDFLYFRRFRQTLLCRAEVTLERPATPERMDAFLFSSRAREQDGQIEGLNSVRITAAEQAAARIAAAMGEVYPLPVSFDELLEYEGDRDALREILFAMIASGFAEFHVHDFPCEQSIPERPRAGRLARWQAARGPLVTGAGHIPAQLDEVNRALLNLLDGTRDFEAIVADLAIVADAPPAARIRELLPETLAWMAGMGLLES